MALVKCRECGREVSTAAEACPHCGFPDPSGEDLRRGKCLGCGQEIEVPPLGNCPNCGVVNPLERLVKKTKPKPETRGCWIGCLGSLGGLWLLWLVLSLWGGSPDPSASRSGAGSPEPSISEISVLCQYAVKAQLRAPGTADFPFGMTSEVKVTSTNSAILSSYVDAENAFGGEVRTNFICTATRQDEAWSVVAIIEP